jgi:hypothetical protein
MAKANDNYHQDNDQVKNLVDRSGIPLPDYLQAAFDNGVHPLKVWRRHRGMAMGELARRAGTSTETIFNMERFNEGPDDDLIDTLADILDANPDALLAPE